MDRPQLSLTHMRRPSSLQEEGDVPTLLLLHGVGSNEEDLMGLADYLEPRWQLISARAPLTLGYGQYGWFQIQIDGRGNTRFDPAEARAALEQLQQFVSEVKGAYDTSPSRLYLAGFSQGAIMSSALLLSAPESVAGAILMSGRSPEGYVEPPANLEPLREKPVLIVHGLYDEVLPVRHGRALRDTFAALPVALEYEEFPMGHSVSMESLERVNHWLAQRLEG